MFRLKFSDISRLVAPHVGGQFNLAAEIPGKEVYLDTIRYFKAQLSLLNVDVFPDQKIGIEDLRDVQVDAIVFATGVVPRTPDIKGIDHLSVMDYETAIKNKSTIKNKVAVIGAGGIGFDVAEMLVTDNDNNWYKTWGVDKKYENRGGLLPDTMNPGEDCVPNNNTARTVYLLQRKDEKLGKNLARTTGWIRRLSLRGAGVKMMSDITYEKIDDDGLHVLHHGESVTLAVDHVIICAGQQSENSLYQQLKTIGQPVHIIGGANKAAELDAETAIRQGMELAYEF